METTRANTPNEATARAPRHFSDLRRANGISLATISQRTKIPVRVLEDLEHERLEHFPPGIFARAYVRAYAVEAQLDPDVVLAHVIRKLPGDEALARVDEVLGGPHASPSTRASSRSTRRWTPLAAAQVRAVAFVAVLGVMLLSALWVGTTHPLSFTGSAAPMAAAPPRAPLAARPVATSGEVGPVVPTDRRLADGPPRVRRPHTTAGQVPERKPAGVEKVFAKVGGAFKKVFGADDDQSKEHRAKSSR